MKNLITELLVTNNKEDAFFFIENSILSEDEQNNLKLLYKENIEAYTTENLESKRRLKEIEEYLIDGHFGQYLLLDEKDGSRHKEQQSAIEHYAKIIKKEEDFVQAFKFLNNKVKTKETLEVYKKYLWIEG